MKLHAPTLRAVYRMWERSSTTKQVDDWLRQQLIRAEAGEECIYGFHPAEEICKCGAAICKAHRTLHEGDHL